MASPAASCHLPVALVVPLVASPVAGRRWPWMTRSERRAFSIASLANRVSRARDLRPWYLVAGVVQSDPNRLRGGRRYRQRPVCRPPCRSSSVVNNRLRAEIQGLLGWPLIDCGSLSAHCGSPHVVLVAPGVILPSGVPWWRRRSPGCRSPVALVVPLVPGGLCRPAQQSDPKRLRGGRRYLGDPWPATM